jgi:hypothetical protein
MKTSILFATVVACALSATIASAQIPARPTTSIDMDKQMSQMQEFTSADGRGWHHVLGETMIITGIGGMLAAGIRAMRHDRRRL